MSTTLKELLWSGTIGVGEEGNAVRRVQEWLCLHGHKVTIDNEFGPKTEAAVRKFQTAHGMPALGRVDGATFRLLTQPMIDATALIEPPDGATLGSLTVLYALKHLAAHAQELEAANSGPWVRLYMKGHEGVAWPWCAGFVSYVVRQAAETLGVKIPFRLSFGCNELASAAKVERRFVDGDGARADVRVGSVFVVRAATQGKWSHTGIVTGISADRFQSCEGNTNVAGAREGTHVRTLNRRYAGHDFLLLDVP